MQQLVATPSVSLDADYVFQEECAHSTDSNDVYHSIPTMRSL